MWAPPESSLGTKPPWDLEFWNVPSLTLSSYQWGNRPQMGRGLSRDTERVSGRAGPQESDPL